jgi:REP element-mobilizing transposase RayT
VRPPEFTIYRRRLPHWRLEGATYFVTWRLQKEQPDLSAAERTLVASAVRYFEGRRYELLAYVVMNDHIHVLVAPMDEHHLEEIVQGWKSYTGHALSQHAPRRSPVWQGEYFDRIVRDEPELIEKAQYILNNPWKRWPGLVEYEWVWARGFE